MVPARQVGMVLEDERVQGADAWGLYVGGGGAAHGGGSVAG